MVLRNSKYALWGFDMNINVDEIKIQFRMNEYIITYYYDKPTMFLLRLNK